LIKCWFDGGLVSVETSELRISQTLETNAEMRNLRSVSKGIETDGFIYSRPFDQQIQVFNSDGVNYLVNGHNRLVIADKNGIKFLKVAYIDSDYLMTRYNVTPEQLIKLSELANKIGNKIRWY
jgi:hypothetical protein